MPNPAEEGAQLDGGTKIKVSAFGWDFDVNGSQAIIILVVVALAGFLLYGAAKMAESVTTALDQKGVTSITGAIDTQTKQLSGDHVSLLDEIRLHEAAIDTQHAVISKELSGMKDAIEVQNFIITQPTSERERIGRQIRVPNSLKDIVNARR